ncbi:unnamed protein product [Chondrus crispus]|uniref:NTR domain-containing protein n=1 Tax=Chondrus crispus TaxID=2769 RepID=R7Q959_CHOCR|nr:unnamed protein product [Chondrus crispus]CDF34589.1 unnamed protein product [Chondrus crispus]|eukprot:XP_005714408.1 unnamed protein product [Chondrus crispus]
MRFSTVVLLTLSVLTTISPTLACSCAPPPTFQKVYCDSPVSFRGTVLARTDNCPGRCDQIADQFDGEIVFIVRVDRHFSGPSVEDGIAYLRTAVNGGLCGIELTVGTQYMFNLRSPQNREGQCPSTVYDIGLCSFPVTWKSLSRELRRFVVRDARTMGALCKSL